MSVEAVSFRWIDRGLSIRRRALTTVDDAIKLINVSVSLLIDNRRYDLSMYVCRRETLARRDQRNGSAAIRYLVFGRLALRPVRTKTLRERETREIRILVRVSVSVVHARTIAGLISYVPSRALRRSALAECRADRCDRCGRTTDRVW